MHQEDRFTDRQQGQRPCPGYQKKAQVSDFEDCSLLILGCPTYGDGDLQTDWDEQLELLEEADLDGKTIALFGTGDQENYPGSFVDAIGTLYDIVVEKKAPTWSGSRMSRVTISPVRPLCAMAASSGWP
ncbi:flavodoxin domain-containing protein [Azotobacter vinelandii]